MRERISGAPTLSASAFGLIFLTYVLNQLDRNIISFVAPELKADLSLSDTQFGVLTGLGFSLTYGFCSFVFAYFADRRDRIAILTGALLAWTCATVACAFTGTFAQLLGARVAVAAGEAGGTPTALGLIGDSVPRQRLASTYGLFMLAMPAGILLAAAGGGFMANHYGWRSAFLICGLPGVLLAGAIKIWVKDPRPSARQGATKPQALAMSMIFRDLVRGFVEVWKIRSAFCILVSFGFSQFFVSGLLAWGPIYFVRFYGLDTQSASLQFGLAMILGLVPGLVVGGMVTDRLARTEIVRILVVPAVTIAFALPLLIATFWVEQQQLALGLLACGVFTINLGLGATLGGFNAVLPSRIRSLGNAIILLFATIISNGLGSFFVGFFSDQLSGIFARDGLRVGIVLTTLVYGAISFIFLLKARRTFSADLTRERRYVQAG